MRIASVFALLILAFGPAHASGFDRDGNPLFGDGTIRDPSDPVAPHPGVMIFDNQADFLAAAGSVTTEDFEDEPLVGDCSSGAQTFLSFDHFDATATPAALKVLGVDCGNGNHNTTPGGFKYLSADTDLGGVSAFVTLSFNTFLHAFGLYLIDIEAGGGSVELTINGVPYLVPGGPNGGESYFGIVSPVSFTDIEIAIVSGSDSHYSLDDIAYGAGPVAVEADSWGKVKAIYR
jgi:hypothetical protein